MSTATKAPASLDPAQRTWLKKMGAALDAPIAKAGGGDAAVAALKDQKSVGDAATTKSFVPELLTWGPGILEVIKKLGGGRRICAVAVVNKTDRVLHRGAAKHESGNFAQLPPDTIKPGETAQFVASSPEPIPVIDVPTEGAIGEMPWMLDGGTSWFIEWRNPVAGKNKGKTRVEGVNAAKFSPDMLFGNGHTAEYRFTLTGGDKPPGPGPGPGPAPGPGPTPGGVDAASSCHVTITNDTKLTLTLGGQGHERGDFMTFPAKTLAPGASTTFVSVETPNAKDAKDEGCKGFVLWQVGSPTVLWRVEWDNPEQSKNSAAASFNPANAGFTSLNQIGQGEENVPVSFTISGGGGGVQPPTTTRKLFVSVAESGTAKPIDGATVVISDKSQKTAGGGKATFDLPPGSHKFKATADGFQPMEGPVEMPGDKDNNLIVLMEPVAGTSKLLVTVMDDANKTIAGATIVVAGKSAKTGADGSAKFTPPPGSQPFKATADGFKENVGTVEITSGKDSDMVLFMEKGGASEFKPPTESKQPTLRKGDKSNDKWVEYLQQLLGLEIDGKFGPATEKAVRKFQTDNKLQVDGVVGNQTWAALRGNTPEQPSTDGRKPHTFEEKGAEARWFTEDKNIADYDKANDELRIVAVSVGTEKIDQFKADIRVIPPTISSKLLSIEIGPSYKQLPGGVGLLHAVRIPKFRKTFGPGKHTIEAFLPQDLGGDNWKGEIDIK
jgi:Putative peptidoglycan binding domain